MAQPLLEFGFYGCIGLCLQQVESTLNVAVSNFSGYISVCAVTQLGELAGLAQCIGDAAQG